MIQEGDYVAVADPTALGSPQFQGLERVEEVYWISEQGHSKYCPRGCTGCGAQVTIQIVKINGRWMSPLWFRVALSANASLLSADEIVGAQV